jgi:hypothetical protein
VESVTVKGQVPRLIAEDPIKSYKRGVSPLITPSVLSILKGQLLKPAMVKSRSEARQEV